MSAWSQLFNQFVP